MPPTCVAVLCVVLWGCAQTTKTPDYRPQIGAAQPAPQAIPDYSFGVLPTQNAIRLFETYQPLIEEINRHISGFKVKFETAKDYPEYETKVRDGRLHFVMLNSHLVIPAEDRGYHVIGRTADRISGVIVIRKGVGIRTPRDLKAASISFAARPDLPGTMMPKVLLKQGGLDLDRDAKPKYVASSESVLLNVSLGLSAAGCVSQSAWRTFQKERPDIAQSLQVRWQTESMVGLGILAWKDVPLERIRAISKTLFNLHETERGREILEAMKISSFKPATSASYDGVWEFLNDYRKMFGRAPTLGGAE
jgi:phosphonate transport system substrate-binding protein